MPNGEWELLETRLIRTEQLYPCCPEPYPKVTVILKYGLTFSVSILNIDSKDKKENPLLRVQHRVPLHDDVNPDGASVLHAPRLGGEDCARSDSHPCVLCLYVSHCRENAGNQ